MDGGFTSACDADFDLERVEVVCRLCSLGCLLRNLSRLKLEKSAGLSSEKRMLTAAVIFPSSSLVDIAAALAESASLLRWFVYRSG